MTLIPLLLALATGEAQPTPPADTGPAEAAVAIPSAFPPGTFDDLKTRWYSEQLHAAGESALDVHGPETYRFTWLRSFHHPVVIKVRADPDHVRLVVKVLSGAGGYEPGTIDLNRTYLIPAETWKAWTARVDKAGYWAMPTREKLRGCDGAQWILEGVRAGSYHVVDRWSPGDDEKTFAALCLQLMDLAHLSIPSRDLY